MYPEVEGNWWLWLEAQSQTRHSPQRSKSGNSCARASALRLAAAAYSWLTLPTYKAAAALMAARIRGYVMQRQRLPAITASMSASVGEGKSLKRAAACMIWPD